MRPGGPGRLLLVTTLMALAVAAATPGAQPAAATDLVRITFHVRVPASTPADASVYVSGDLPELGTWDGRGVQLTRRPDGRFEGVVALPRGTAFEYKLTRGSWDSVEKDARGAEIRNRSHVADADATVEVTVENWRDPSGDGPAVARRSTLSGTIRKHTLVPSRFVASRDVWVYLPPGYDSTASRRYPVVYFHDGNNVFDEATSFLGIEWGVDEVAEMGIRAGRLPAFIAVAVANTAARTREYSWKADPRHGGGAAMDYARFLIEELKPMVDRAYATDSRAEATAVVGSSLGGNVSLWLGLEHPGFARRIGCVSPAAGWADSDLARQVRAGSGTGLRIWLDIGTAEVTPRAGESAWWLEHARDLNAALEERGYRAGTDLHYEEVPGGRHNEAAWAARVGRILEFLLASPGTPR